MSRLARRICCTAATLALGLALAVVPTTPAIAGTDNGKGAKCAAYYAAYVCGYLNFDRSVDWNPKLRAYGGIEDTSFGSVWVRASVCVQSMHKATGNLHTGACSAAAGGWDKVTSHSGLAEYCSTAWRYRSVILWAWEPPGSPAVTGVGYSQWVDGDPYCR